MAILGSSDIVTFSLIALYKKAPWVKEFLTEHLNPTVVITFGIGTTCLFALLQIYSFVKILRQDSTNLEEFPVKPLLFPCKTSHVRIFPKKHGFSYSYLWVGIPIGWKGSSGGMISADEARGPVSWWKRWFWLSGNEAWYTVNGDDYLDRGHVADGLQGKLRNYLESQNVDPTQYEYAYLMTAAKFLGYASNPVSFWLLYSSSKELKALVLEVNNTFDERRIYFLEPNHDEKPRVAEELPIPPRYTGTWPKDFYVSTFNDRSGAYSLAAYDPLFPAMTRAGPINATITLSSSGRAMLIARLCSSAPALDPTMMSVWEKTKFLSSWWWVGFATFPRTVQQAFILLFRKSMPWVFRPEPKKATMPRRADESELLIESQFRLWLRTLVENSHEPLTIRYSPAGLVPSSSRDVEIMSSPAAQLSPEKIQELEIRVLTPLFYSRFIRYPSLQQAFKGEHYESTTIYLSDPEQLAKLDLSAPSSTPKQTHSNWNIWLIKHLRKTPSPIQGLPNEERILPKDLSASSSEILSPLTPFDNFVLTNTPSTINKQYTSRIAKLLLAQRYALGSVELLDLGAFLFKLGFFWGVLGYWLQ